MPAWAVANSATISPPFGWRSTSPPKGWTEVLLHQGWRSAHPHHPLAWMNMIAAMIYFSTHHGGPSTGPGPENMPLLSLIALCTAAIERKPASANICCQPATLSLDGSVPSGARTRISRVCAAKASLMCDLLFARSFGFFHFSVR